MNNTIQKRFLFSLTLASMTGVIFCEEAPKNEAHYRDEWAKKNGGKTEVALAGGTRCDVMTETHAVEVEFAEKWAEGFGQALWYSCLLYTSPSPRDLSTSRMPSSA